MLKFFPFKVECVQTDNGCEFTKKFVSNKKNKLSMFEKNLTNIFMLLILFIFLMILKINWRCILENIIIFLCVLLAGFSLNNIYLITINCVSHHCKPYTPLFWIIFLPPFHTIKRRTCAIKNPKTSNQRPNFKKIFAWLPITEK